MSRLAILDPLTLMGRELTAEIHRRFPGIEPALFHTSDDEEHQIASIDGRPALVPPLKSPADLEDIDVLVLAADDDGARLDFVGEALENDDHLIFIDASPLDRFRFLTVPSFDADSMAPGARLRPALPAVVVAGAVIETLSPFGPLGMTIAVVEPVSVYGRDAVVTLASQAAQRLQGETVTEEIDHRIAAFNLTARSAEILREEAASLLPGLEIAATRTLGGCFHGHLILIGLTFEAPVVAEAVSNALDVSPLLAVTPFPIDLTGIGDRADIVLTPPELSSGGRSLTLQAMVDGTRIGGAATVAAMLQGIQ